MTKRGKEREQTALAPTNYSDDEVAKFLFDAGLAHLWKGET